MGIAEADLNEDGVPDYLVSDMGRPITLVSQADGTYAESGLAYGLRFESQPRIIGWSIEVEDLDNDGALDVALTGGHSGASFRAVADEVFDDPDYIVQHPDTLWRGRRAEDGLQFSDVTADVGFGDIGNHYGQAAADFDGDGFLDLAMGSVDGPWKLWMNTCSDGQWVEVDFEGAPGNRAGWGVIARMEADGRVQERELLGTRGYGQSPSRLHFGLGEADTIDSLEVIWPDGATERWEDMPAGSVLTVKHPLAD
jgi:hypothetical protein